MTKPNILDLPNDASAFGSLSHGDRLNLQKDAQQAHIDYFGEKQKDISNLYDATFKALFMEGLWPKTLSEIELLKTRVQKHITNCRKELQQLKDYVESSPWSCNEGADSCIIQGWNKIIKVQEAMLDVLVRTLDVQQ